MWKKVVHLQIKVRPSLDDEEKIGYMGCGDWAGNE